MAHLPLGPSLHPSERSSQKRKAHRSGARKRSHHDPPYTAWETVCPSMSPSTLTGFANYIHTPHKLSFSHPAPKSWFPISQTVRLHDSRAKCHLQRQSNRQLQNPRAHHVQHRRRQLRDHPQRLPRNLRPLLPHQLLIMDSTPGSSDLSWGNVTRWSRAMALGAAAWFPWSFAVTPIHLRRVSAPKQYV